MAKARRFSVHRLQPAPSEDLHNLPERIGLGVSRPTMNKLRQQAQAFL